MAEKLSRRGFLKPYAKSALQGVGMLIPETALQIAAKKVGIQSGNPSLTNAIELHRDGPVDNPLYFHTTNSIAAPVIEEGIVRGLPSAAVNLFDKNGLHLEVGLITIAALALSHNLTTDQDGEKFHFAKSIPLPQITHGVFEWILTRKKGVTHSMVAHSAHNTVFGILLHIIDIKLRKRKEKEKQQSIQDQIT